MRFGEKKKHTPATNPPSVEDHSKILKKYRATRIIIGHAPVSKNKILLSHPRFGKKVVMIDSCISKKRREASAVWKSTGLRSRPIMRNETAQEKKSQTFK